MNHRKLTIACLLFLVFTLATSIPVCQAGQTKLKTVVTNVSSNSSQDGYIVKTQNGVFELAFGAGGYGRFDVIYSSILESMNKKTPVTLLLNGKDIEDIQ
ncbi:MAG: hypothetical protein HQK55_11040 [Deltaproteobacteria bacterium]|nr:hypothetical protein [Deltaproteobacteria bacterium]